MVDFGRLPDSERSRVAWWAYVLALGGGFLFVLYSFVGTVVLGTFGYYATRPLYDRLARLTDSDGIAAGATVLFVVLPVLLLLAYAGFTLIDRASALTGGGLAAYEGLLKRAFGVGPIPEQGFQVISATLQNPAEAIQNHRETARQLLTAGAQLLVTVASVLLHLVLALTLSFYLLRDDDRIAAWFRGNVADRDTATYAYARAVDGDLETVYYGNLVFVALMSVIAAVVYVGANAVAPDGLRIPAPFVLAVLTGVSALIPIVVSKVVYLPLVGYLALSATSIPGGQLWFPVALLGVSIVLLDLAPQMLIQPYVTGGNEIHMGLMMFAYILGPILFGWYGFFYLPLLLVLGVEVIRIVFTQLIHGDRLTPTVEAAESLGTDSSDHQ